MVGHSDVAERRHREKDIQYAKEIEELKSMLKDQQALLEAEQVRQRAVMQVCCCVAEPMFSVAELYGAWTCSLTLR